MTGRTDNSRITKVLSTLVALLDGPKSPGELMASTGCAHTTTWLHITALKDMGLVRLKERRKPPHGGEPVPVYEHSLDQFVKTNQT